MKRAKKQKNLTVVQVANDCFIGMDEAGPAEGHQPPTRAAPTQACWRGPFSPSKKLRLAAGRDVRVAAMALLKMEKCMPKHLDAYNVAERIYNSKKSKPRGGRSKKRRRLFYPAWVECRSDVMDGTGCQVYDAQGERSHGRAGLAR